MCLSACVFGFQFIFKSYQCVYGFSIRMFARACEHKSQIKYQRTEEMMLFCVCNDFIRENDRWLFGKRTKKIRNKTKHTYTLQWRWWCENTNMNAWYMILLAMKYNELPHLAELARTLTLRNRKKRKLWFKIWSLGCVIFGENLFLFFDFVGIASASV